MPTTTSQNPEFLKYHEFAAALLKRIEKFRNEAVTSTTHSRLQLEIAQYFGEIKRHQQMMLVFTGLQIVAADVVHAPTPDSDRIVLSMKTDFWPAPRYERHFGNCKPLGFFEQYDLYLAQQSVLPPMLIARYGNESRAYGSFNPKLLGEERLQEAGSHFVEAHWRARFLGFDLGL